jgi:hypothetical protein
MPAALLGKPASREDSVLCGCALAFPRFDGDSGRLVCSSEAAGFSDFPRVREAIAIANYGPCLCLNWVPK